MKLLLSLAFPSVVLCSNGPQKCQYNFCPGGITAPDVLLSFPAGPSGNVDRLSCAGMDPSTIILAPPHICDALPTFEKDCCPAAQPSPGGNGDPHFTTWKDEHFEFHGQCDLVLAKDPQSLFESEDMGLDVHIRTKIVRHWSYIQAVAIRIGNDVLEIQGNADSNIEPKYWINFEYQGDLATLSGFPVTQTSSRVHKRSYLIDLSSNKPGYSIQVDLYREFVGVKFNGNKNGYRNTVGLLGDASTGKMLARDGNTEMLDYTDFGNEWQVRPFEQKLFHEMADPQFPIGCIQPEDPRGERRRRLAESSIGMEEAEIACASLKDPASVKDCVYDILSTQDLDMVGAY